MFRFRWISILTLALAAALALAGCSGSAQESPARSGEMVNIAAADLLKRIQGGEEFLIVDVRTPEEYAEGHIEGARLLPLQSIEQEIKSSGIAKDQQVVLICRSGNRSAQAYRILSEMGYTDLINVQDGMNGWLQAGGPVVR